MMKQRKRFQGICRQWAPSAYPQHSSRYCKMLFLNKMYSYCFYFCTSTMLWVFIRSPLACVSMEKSEWNYSFFSKKTRSVRMAEVSGLKSRWGRNSAHYYGTSLHWTFYHPFIILTRYDLNNVERCSEIPIHHHHHHVLKNIYQRASMAQLNARLTDDQEGQQHSFVEIDHEIFSTVIFPFTDSRRAVVGFWWKNVHNTGAQHDPVGLTEP